MISDISQISVRYLKKDKLRTALTSITIIAAVAIILLGGGLLVGMRDLLDYDQFSETGYQQGTIEEVDVGLYRRLRLNVNVEEVSLDRPLGVATKLVFETGPPREYTVDKPPLIREYDGNSERINPDLLVAGRFPSSPNEVALDSTGSDPIATEEDLGLTVHITRQIESSGEEMTQSYTIVGLMRRQEASYSSPYASVVIGMGEPAPDTVYRANVFLKDDAGAQAQLTGIMGRLGISFDQLTMNPKYENFGNNYGAALVFTGIGILYFLTIAALSFGGIYAVFNLTYWERMRQYGLIRAIGATESQIRQIVKREILVLSATCIPIGAILGTVLQFFLFRMLNQEVFLLFGYRDFQIRIYPMVILLTSAISFFFVYVSIYSASLRRGNLYPQDMMRQSEEGGRVSGFKKKYRITRFLFGMEAYLAKRNLDRAKSKFFLTSISIAVTITLFVLALFVAKANTHTAQNMGIGFTDLHIEYSPVNMDQAIEIKHKLEDLEGVTAVYQRYTIAANLILDSDQIMEDWKRELPMEELASGQTLYYNQAVYIADHEEFGEMMGIIPERQSEIMGEVLEEGGAIVLLNGSTIHDDTGTTSNTVEIQPVFGGYAVLPISTYAIKGDYPFGPNVAIMVIVPYGTFLSNFQNTSLEDVPVILNINVQDEAAINRVSGLLEQYGVGSASIFSSNYEDRTKTLAKYETLNSFMYLFIGAIVLLSVLNLFNAMSTNTFTRKRELSILKAVGMSDKQMLRMLSMESQEYCIVGAILSFVFSLILLQLIGSGIYGQFLLPIYGGPSTIQYPIIGYFLAVAVTFLVSNLASRFAFRRITGEEFVENLK
ncbi:MAG: FtsX-like permease family protein [Tissierellia bacterium]|nr:FtsX-like permease family protein [Tissierellia bacterium]